MPLSAATLGSAVPLGGHASDMALETAGPSIRVAPYPWSIALSPGGRFVVAGHFGNLKAPNSTASALTAMDLVSSGPQTPARGDPPLGAAFGADGRVLVVNTTQFLLFDPVSGVIRALDTIAGVTAGTQVIDALRTGKTFGPGARLSGWLHALVPMVGVTFAS